MDTDLTINYFDKNLIPEPILLDILEKSIDSFNDYKKIRSVNKRFKKAVESEKITDKLKSQILKKISYPCKDDSSCCHSIPFFLVEKIPNSPLFLKASTGGHLFVVDRFLKKGNIDRKTQGMEALEKAVQCGKHAVVKRLLQEKDIKLDSRKIQSLKEVAKQTTDVEMVNLLNTTSRSEAL